MNGGITHIMKVNNAIKKLFLFSSGILWLLTFFSHLYFFSCPNMNITPFSRSQLISIMVITLVSYLLLEPFHELGHYHKATKIASSQNYDVNFCLKWNYTSCSDWSIFKEAEQIDILKAGSFNKIAFCGICIFFALITCNFFLLLSFLYVILFEYYQNCTCLFPKNDYYYIHHLDEFVQEPKYMDAIRQDFFIRKIYPYLLAVGFILYIIICFILLSLSIKNKLTFSLIV